MEQSGKGRNTGLGEGVLCIFGGEFSWGESWWAELGCDVKLACIRTAWLGPASAEDTGATRVPD